MLDLIERARRYILRCPPAISGQGGHNATFHVASILVWGFGLSEGDAFALLSEWNRTCQPPWSEADLLYKIRSAANCAHKEKLGYHLGGNDQKKRNLGVGVVLFPKKKPVFCPGILKRIAAQVSSISDVEAFLAARSREPVQELDSAGFLRCLYPKAAGERVLIFSDMRSQGQMLWEAEKGDCIANHQLPAGPEGVWILPQPVDGAFHPNPRLGGRSSRRSEESVIAWKYVLIESDEADRDEWLRCLIQLPLRIGSICDSGVRSIHALAVVDAKTKGDWDAKVARVKPLLVTLGADPQALSAVRLTRLPQAKRGERVQRLLYVNPAPAGVPILEQLRRE